MIFSRVDNMDWHLYLERTQEKVYSKVHSNFSNLHILGNYSQVFTNIIPMLAVSSVPPGFKNGN